MVLPNRRLIPPREQGGITALMAIGIAALLGMLVLAIDLGQLYVVKNELQNVADAAALAGAKKLVQAKDTTNPGTAAVYCEEAITAAQSLASQNNSSGVAMTIEGTDVVLGQWSLTTNTFTRTGCSTNPLDVTGIQVTVRRTAAGPNATITSLFAGFFGISQMATQATAVAYLGLAGTSYLNLPFAVPSGYPAGQAPYSQKPTEPPWLAWLGPSPAYAANPQPYTWKDLGGSTLDATRATFIMPLNSERTDLSKLQKYIKGPSGGGLQYPQVKVGQTVYPISEWQWATNVYNNFSYLKTRYNAEAKVPGTNKWRVTVAVFSPTPVTAAAPAPPLLGLLASLFSGPSQAFACTSYTVPAVYVQGLVTVDVTGVTCDSVCKNYAYPDSRSCYKTCYMNLEVPLTSNFVSPDKGSNPIPYQHNYQTMNPSANPVGVFSAIPRLVK